VSLQNCLYPFLIPRKSFTHYVRQPSWRLSAEDYYLILLCLRPEFSLAF
jgi:hypothetical protein